MTEQTSFAGTMVSGLRKMHCSLVVAPVLSCHSCCGNMVGKTEETGLFGDLIKIDVYFRRVGLSFLGISGLLE